MKNNLILLFVIIFLSGTFISCNNDDNSSIITSQDGKLEIYFDNGFAGDQLILNTSTHTNSLNETLKINRINYIISNIVLTKEDGTEFIYPKNSSYFIINEEENNKTITLENIPSGKYKKIKFGIGVDEQKHLEGQTAQEDFWALAQANNMTWAWAAGYKFINFEGTFTSLSETEEKSYKVHLGKTSSEYYNYSEVTLDLPSLALVQGNTLPNIHIKTDLNVILDGVHKISLQEQLNPTGTSANIMGGQNLVYIAENIKKMFVVDHVHNGQNSH